MKVVILGNSEVYLSPIDLSQIERYLVWFSDFETVKPIGGLSEAFTMQSKVDALCKILSINYNFEIFESQNETSLGCVQIFDIDFVNRRGEVGIVIAESAKRNRNYGTAALNLTLEYCFDILNLHNLFARVISSNKGAMRLFEKVGFREVGRRKEAVLTKGDFWDIVFWELLSKDWRKRIIT